jgi:hypothetical protein
MLASYWYWRKRDLTQLDKMAAPLTAVGGRLELFADSGAFSAHTQRGGGVSIKREDYAAWLSQWRPRLRVMANLDVIGDPKATARNQLWFEERGLPVLPVFHGTSPLTELEALCRDYDYIALGGTAALHAKRAAMLAYTARVALIAREHGTVLHGFGRSSTADLDAIPFYSVDSTTWMQAARYGDIHLFNGRELRRIPVRKAIAEPALIRKHGGDPQRMCRPDYGNLALRDRRDPKQYAAYRRENDEVVFIAGVAWKRYEAWLQRRHHVPPPPGHETTGTVVWFADDNMLHQQQMIKAVAWLAAASTARRYGRESDEAV